MNESQQQGWWRPRRAVALFVTAGLVLAACGGGDATEETTDASTAADTEAASPAGGDTGSESASSSEGGTEAELSGTLAIWDWQSECWGDTLSDLNDEFEELHPELTIERTVQPFDEYPSLVQTANASRSGPDALMMLPGGQHALAFEAALETLNDRVDDEMLSVISDWDSLSRNFNQDDGIIGVPTGLQGMVYWYNQEKLDEAGAEVPTTFEELETSSQALVDAGIGALGGGNANGSMDVWAFSLMYPAVATPEQAMGLGSGELPFTDQTVMDTLDMYLGLIEQGYFPEGLQSTPLSPDGLESFKAGDQGMSVGLAAEFYSYTDFIEAWGEENVGFMPPLPHDGSEINYLPVGAAVSWGITSYSENKDAAWEYIRFLTMDNDNVVRQFEDCGVMPNNTNVEVTDVPPQVDELRTLFGEYDLQLPVHQLWPAEVLDEYMRQMQLVHAGDIDAQTAMEAVTAAQ